MSAEEQKATIDEYKAKGFPLVVVDGVELGGYAHVVRLHSQGRLKHLGAVGQGSGAGGADADAPERMTWAERMSRLYAATRSR